MAVEYREREQTLLIDPQPIAPVQPSRRLIRLGDRVPFGTYLRELWQLRYFTWLLAVSKAEKANQGQYRTPMWRIVDPFMHKLRMILMFTLLITDRDSQNAMSFLVVGLFMWDLWEGFITHSLRVMKSNKSLLSAHSFPTAIIVISSALSHVINDRYKLIVTTFIVLISGIFPNMQPIFPTLNWLAVVPIFFLLIIWGLGAACIAARLGIYFPHIHKFLTIPFMFLRVASGVMFNPDRFLPIFGPTVMYLIQQLPGATFVYLLRSVILQDPMFPPSTRMWILSAFWAVLTFIVGIIVFWQNDQNYGRDARQLTEERERITVDEFD